MDEIKLTKQEAEVLLNYLARRPYLEVYQLINMIQCKFIPQKDEKPSKD